MPERKSVRNASESLRVDSAVSLGPFGWQAPRPKTRQARPRQARVVEVLERRSVKDLIIVKAALGG